MKVNYKKIHRVTPVIVDHYYGCTMDDFLDDDQCAEINAQRIREIILRGRMKRAVARNPSAFPSFVVRYFSNQKEEIYI